MGAIYHFINVAKIYDPFVEATKNARSDFLNPPETIRAVICHLQRKSDSKYLLLRKAKGKFGEGFWNAPGGKIERGESPEHAAIREVFEETSLVISNLEMCGELEFYFGEDKVKPDWTAVVFKTTCFEGNPKMENEEGMLRWFDEKDFPMKEMWEDDRYWLPFMFRGVRFRGSFRFTSDSKRLVSHSLEKLQ